MRFSKLVIIVIPIVLLAGCWTLSLHPLYFEKDLVFDPALEGSWSNPDDADEIWTFERMDEKSYALTVFEDVNVDTLHRTADGEIDIDPGNDPKSFGEFEAHLVQLGDYYFLDLYPEDTDVAGEFIQSHILLAHSFYKINIAGDTLIHAVLDAEWLEESIEQGIVNIKHEQTKDMIVLTASTGELQQFVLKYAEDAFSDSNIMIRLK